VPDDQLSLAIGREGLNARLAARLTGWRIDIRSETEFAQEEAEGGYEEEVASGRCAAILTSGRRCPNAALPGSRFCGLPAHQALAETGSDYVGGEPPEGGEPPVEGDPFGAPSPVADEAGDEVVAEAGEVDIDDAPSAVEVETAETDTGDEEIESVDVERTAHDDVDETAVTDDDLEGPGGEGQ
jgi:N utilization substance protein A